LFRLFPGNNLIYQTAGNQYTCPRKIRELLRHEGHHGAKEDGVSERFWVKQEQTGGYVCTVRVSNCDESAGVEAIDSGRRLQETCELVCTEDQVLGVEDPFGYSPEEPWGSVLKYPSSRAQQIRTWRKLVTELKEIILVPASAVEEEQSHRLRSLFGGNEAVDEH